MDNNNYDEIQEIKYVNEYRKLNDIFSIKKLRERTYIDKFIWQTFISLIIIALLFLDTSINSAFTNKIYEGVKSAVAWNIDLSKAKITFLNIKNIIPEAKNSLGLTEISDNENFIMPIEGTITSEFGLRIHPIYNTEKMHNGIDIGGEIGLPIKASISGKVIEVDEDELNGKYLKIQKGSIETIYAHCSKIYAKIGENVKQGDIIAEVGDTGIASGPHVHFEIWEDGIAVDPVEKINADASK